MSMNATVMHEVRTAIDLDVFWQPYIDDVADIQPPTVAVHLAIFVEPYLQYILDGKKTVESRFSVHRCPPYGTVREGDVVLLKRASGPIVGLCRVGTVWSYELNPDSLSELRSEFASAICAQDPSFWIERSSASYATLMRLQHVRPISPIEIDKRDRRGWVVLRRRSRQFLMWDE
ncbi:MAG: ASCH domain-containing protein [Planctomycetes bacterium]|nr:ASCH domain-containing protein [Planctomycetota bacterium]